ncbi:hypothetical protein B4U80_08401 [Leptotrombidium deliense]|uniref:Transmembrane protein 256-like protein n=1 Tax=Leptotrombidium deliense TaxID=299467 RepID=A0A443SHT1_9ACAR|nr:hypothetical protein B4U80_08401 [Leptotrombidium deliense]
MDYITSATKAVTATGYNVVELMTGYLPKRKVEEKVVAKSVECVHKGLGILMGPERHWLKVAGICGALGVALGAYGEHGLKPDFPASRKKVFDVANKYHMIHSLALLAVPLSRRPNVVGGLFATGMLVFCGTCYIHALTGNEAIIRFTPYGGMTIMLAWLSFLL